MAQQQSAPQLSDILKDSTRPAFLFGSVPPREGTTEESARETCAKFAARSAVLATDGFIVYDIQDERGRTDAERPFPFKKTMDPSLYASFFPPVSGKQCVVYKSVVEAGEEFFQEWVDKACDKYNHNAFNLVGAPSSNMKYDGLHLPEAAALMRRRGGCAFGCVAIPERHTKKGNEDENMLRKVDFGAEWFITQGVYASEPISKLLNAYGDLCRSKGIVPKKVILTFAPCGRAKTMTFIKWLGMHVPEEAEKRIFEAAVPVKESVTLCKELLLTVLQQTHNSGVPIGVNVESLSIFKDEIDAAHDLFQLLQATLLNSRGSPWAIRWFPVAESRLYTPSLAGQRSVEELLLLDEASRRTSGSSSSIKKRSVFELLAEEADDLTTPMLIVGLAGITGIVIGRYLR